MKKKIFTLLLTLAVAVCQGQEQYTKPAGTGQHDSVIYKTTFFFPQGQGNWIGKSEYAKMSKLLDWAKTVPSAPIIINGWADKSGSEERNAKISLSRARTIRNYLVKQGIAAERISFYGNGVDKGAANAAKARRADVQGVIRLARVSEPEKEIITEPEKQETITEPEVSPQPEVVTETQQQIPAEPVTEQTTGRTSSPWYMGGGFGMSFGQGTFCSFAANGTHPGFYIGGLAGYQINRLLSAEVSLDYTRMRLGAYDCCQHFWLGTDGNYYLAPVSGMQSYRYSDLKAMVNLLGLGLHLNVDLMGVLQPDSRWSVMLSPTLSTVFSSAAVKQGQSKVLSGNRFHFGMGMDLGAGYQITGMLGLRFTTGINYLTGKPIDNLPEARHKSNYVWNSALKLIIKLNP